MPWRPPRGCSCGASTSGATLTERILLAGGVGAACSETTRHAVRWVVERHSARGPLAERLNEIAHADDLLPLLAVAVLFALVPSHGHRACKCRCATGRPSPSASGCCIGAGAALLVRSELKLDETWAVLFGVSLIAIGTTARLGALDADGELLRRASPCRSCRKHGSELRAMVAPTERPVLLPALLLAGAHLDFHDEPAAAVDRGGRDRRAARWRSSSSAGCSWPRRSPRARREGSWGCRSCRPGALAISIGLAFALRFPGLVGDTVLVVAALSATVGEFVGPARLRNALQRAGEIEDGASATPTSGRAPA